MSDTEDAIDPGEQDDARTDGDIAKVQFVNMVLRVDEGANDYFSMPAEFRQMTRMEAIPPGFEDDIQSIRDQTRKKMGNTRSPRRFNVTVGDMRFRAIPLYPTDDGHVWYSYRRIPPVPKRLDELGFRADEIARMRRIMGMQGLILIGGGFENGKTTTASSMLYDYQQENAGLAITVERPVEYPIADRESQQGLCIQIAADDFEDADWERVTADIRKATPSIVFIGEISDASTARAAIRLAALGRPVLSTIHGGSHHEVILNLVDQAKAAGFVDPEKSVAAVITAIIHQTLVGDEPETRTVIAGKATDHPLRKAIRAMDVSAIDAECQDQTRKLMQNPEESENA